MLHQLGRRPDPLETVELRLQLSNVEAALTELARRRGEIEKHLAALDAEAAAVPMAEHASLAALEISAREAGGRLPDGEAQEELEILREKLVDRPRRLRTSFTYELSGLQSERTRLENQLPGLRQLLGQTEKAVAVHKRQDALSEAIAAMRGGRATPAQRELVQAAGGLPSMPFRS